MNRINRKNYEVFFQDYMDGNLDDQLKKEVENFLLLNPDLKDELDCIADYDKLKIPEIEFRKKNYLKAPETIHKRPIDDSNIDSYLIAFYEHDLNEKQIRELNIFLEKNTGAQKLQKFYKNTILLNEKKITFHGKKKLYKSQITYFNKNRIIYLVSSAAAVILLLFIYKINIKNTQVDHKLVTQIEQTSSNIPENDLQNYSVQNNSEKHMIKQQGKLNSAQLIEPDNLEQVPDKESEISEMTLDKIDGLQVEPLATVKQLIVPTVNIKEEKVVAEVIPESDNVTNNLKDKLAIANPLDFNKDKKVKYWELLQFASNTINKLTVDDMFILSFNDEGKFTEFSVRNDFFKVTKYSKN